MITRDNPCRGVSKLFHLGHYFKSADNPDPLSKSLLKFKDNDPHAAEKWAVLACEELGASGQQVDLVVRVLGSGEINPQKNTPLDKLGAHLVSAGICGHYLPECLKKRAQTSPLKMMSRSKREEEVSGVYTFTLPRGLQLRTNPSVLVIDDVTTTGSSLKEVARAIHEVAPLASVFAFTLVKTRKRDQESESHNKIVEESLHRVRPHAPWRIPSVSEVRHHEALRRPTLEGRLPSDCLGIKWILIEGLDHPFYLSATQLTFDQYEAFCSQTGRSIPDDKGWGRGNRPVINVPLEEARCYCQWASEKSGMTVRLPKEAEWEFAARGGKHASPYRFSGGNRLEDAGWYVLNSEMMTQEVGQKNPNALGLYDMSGNVWEICDDLYDQEHDWTVLRGGAWFHFEKYCRIASRGIYHNKCRLDLVGFRVVAE